MEYEEVQKISKDAAEKEFISGDKESICNALVSVSFYEADWKWAQDKCLYFLLNSNDLDIKGVAITCLGHIGRIHHCIEKEKVLKILQNYLDDVDISGRVQDTLQDIEMFVK